MSAVKTERLLNLVICLLSTRRPLSKTDIRRAIPQYADTSSPDAFERMFERDKDELRELGIPLVTMTVDSAFEDDQGYLIDRDAYALAEITFEPDELAVLGLAARVWHQASLSGPASRALTKLSAAGSGQDADSLIGVEPRVRTAEPTFDDLWTAVRDRVPVAFSYRKPNQKPQRRELEPWAVTSWRGRWYVTGLDRDRHDTRVFRLSRIEGDVTLLGTPGAFETPTTDPLGWAQFFTAAESPEEKSPALTAVIQVRQDSGHSLRRRASSTTPADVDGWDLLTVQTDNVDTLAGEVAALGASAVALTPDDFRQAVITSLRGAAQLDPTGSTRKANSTPSRQVTDG
ncbi:MAG: helix-turn-helix transcriptional regulator [Actinomycetota bacterium]